MFCVRCGREAGDALSSNGLCAECFRAANVFIRLPTYVDLEVCVHCRARRRGELWLDPPEGGVRYEPIVAAASLDALEVDKRVRGLATRVDVVPEDERNYAVTVAASGTAEDVGFEESATTKGRVKNATCTRCSRMQGNYYESIVQVRAEDRDLTPEDLAEVRAVASRVIDRIVDAGDRNAFVLKDEETHGGLDIYVATNNAGRQMAKAVASELGGRTREHPKIAGQKDGLEIWRITFSVKLPKFRVGDVVVVKEEPLLVSAISAKNVRLVKLANGHTRSVERDDLARVTVLPRREARDAVVVAQSEAEMQVLDPWTYATVTVLKPAGMAEAGETVPVLRWEEELLPLPPREEKR